MDTLQIINHPKHPPRLSAVDQRRLAKLQAQQSLLCSAVIAAGHGALRFSELVRMAETTNDPLLVEYVATTRAITDIHEEFSRRTGGCRV